MMSDHGRNNLFIHMNCSECGRRLDFGREPANEEAAPEGHAQGLPTGGSCLHVGPIFVHPCRYCIGKHTGPARKLAEAIKEMGE